jgi:hypothetical protein
VTWLALAARRQLERVPDATLDAHPGVDRSLGGDLERRALAQHTALPHVRTLGVLPDHDELVRAVVPGGRADERALVDVQVELEAHLQQEPPLDHAGRHTGRTDGAEQDRVEVAQLGERLVAQHLAVAEVPRAAQIELGGREVDTGRGHHLQRLRRDLGADAVPTDDRDPVLCATVRHGARI